MGWGVVCGGVVWCGGWGGGGGVGWGWSGCGGGGGGVVVVVVGGVGGSGGGGWGWGWWAVRTGCPIPRLNGLDVLFTQTRIHRGNKTRQNGLNHDYNMVFLISSHECCQFALKCEYVLEARVLTCATPIVTSCSTSWRWELSPHNAHHEGREERDPLLRPGCLNALKAILSQWNIFAMNLRTSLEVMLFIMISMSHQISLKWH